MSLREKQKVQYHTISTDLWAEFVELPKAAQRTFVQLLEHIDKKDNCLQLSYTAFVRLSGLSVDVVKKGLKALQHADFIRKGIIDIEGINRYMVNPKAAWSYSGAEHEFSMKVYHLGSHKAACGQRMIERNIAGVIHPITGELTGTDGYPWQAIESHPIEQEELLYAA